MSPCDFESTLAKAGGSEIKERFWVEETTGESPGRALLWLPRAIIGKK